MSNLLRRIVYYSVVLIGGLVVHLPVFNDLFGGLLRRNSEAYVMMWIPLFWDLFLPHSDPDGLGAETRVGGRSFVVSQALWFGVLSATVLILQTSVGATLWDDLPGAITTLGEGFVAALVISGYLAWSRGLLAASRRTVSGLAVVASSRRVIYYLVVLVMAVAAAQAGMRDFVGSGVADWLRINTEAYAAMLLIPGYFDLIAASRRPGVRLLWYGSLLAAPFVVQLALSLSLAPGPLFAWLETTTEAFLAAFVVSAYFDLIRGRLGHDVISTFRQMADDSVEQAG